MSQLIHAVSRVRAMESQLLTSNAVERMISADSFDSAYAVLDDLGYAEESSYFRENKDFEGVLEMGLYASSKIFKSFALEKKFRICTVLLDIQNISLAIKSKEKGENEDVLQKKMIPYGYYSIEMIINAVFYKTGNVELITLVNSISSFSSMLEKEKHISSFLFEKAKEEAKDNVFCQKFISLLEQSDNLKSEILTADKSVLMSLFPQFSKIINSLFKSDITISQQIVTLESLLDENILNFLKESSLGKIDGFEPIFSFFWRKERNARVIRSILLAKRAGISPKEIRKDFSSFIF